MIPPYCFRRQRDGKYEEDKAYFVCKFCEPDKFTYANATLHFDDAGKKQYKLVHWPLSHECMPSPIEHLIEMFSPLCFEEVSVNPTKPIGQIYKEVRVPLLLQWLRKILMQN